jgi:hypothetical protein
MSVKDLDFISKVVFEVDQVAAPVFKSDFDVNLVVLVAVLEPILDININQLNG